MVSLYFITNRDNNDKIAKKDDGSICISKISDRKELKRINKTRLL